MGLATWTTWTTWGPDVLRQSSAAWPSQNWNGSFNIFNSNWDLQTFTILHHSWGAKSWGFHVPTSITMGWSTPPPPQGPPSTPRERPSSRSSRSSRPSRPWVKTVERSRRTKKHSFRVWMMQMILKHFKTIKLHQIRPLSSPLSSNSNPSSNPNDPKNRS